MIPRTALVQTPHESSATVRPARLVRAAEEFESYLMKELTAPLVKRDCLTEDANEEEGSNGALGEFAANALAQALSQAGGLGIAQRVLRYFPASGKGADCGR